MENSTVFSKKCRVKIGALGMALAIVAAAMAVRPAPAAAYEHHGRQWRAQRHYRRGRWHRRYEPAPNVYYAPPPVVYAPPPPPGGFTFIFPFRIR